MLPQTAHLPDFSPESKVWMYTAGRTLTDSEAALVQQALKHFTQRWTAHNEALKAHGEVFANRVLILMVDESQAGASGCSIDKSVHFLEHLGEELGVDFFERMTFGFLDAHGDLHFADRDACSALRDSGQISDNTLMLNSLADKKQAISEKLFIPYKDSWHKRVF
ncbi:MAG: hypothetical protein J0L99_14220 [Chitinophagales bacterium]|nr:hypothetical protein [Chitinophagales bacterium]